MQKCYTMGLIFAEEKLLNMLCKADVILHKMQYCVYKLQYNEYWCSLINFALNVLHLFVIMFVFK